MSENILGSWQEYCPCSDRHPRQNRFRCYAVITNNYTRFGLQVTQCSHENFSTKNHRIKGSKFREKKIFKQDKHGTRDTHQELHELVHHGKGWRPDDN